MSQRNVIEVLKFYRAESTLEYSLLNSRLGWFVVVQSFLITAFSQAIGYKLSSTNWFAWYMLPIVGIIASIVVIPGINGACDTIDMWLRKQRKLFSENADELKDFMLVERDTNPTVSEDKIHTHSHYFAKWIPWICIAMWLTILVLTRMYPLIIS